MNRDDKDILNGIGEMPSEEDTLSKADDAFIDELFSRNTSGTDEDTVTDAELTENDEDALLDELFASKKGPQEAEPVKEEPEPVKEAQTSPVVVRRRPRQDIVMKKKPAPAAEEPKEKLRDDARYTMTPEEIETLATAAEDAVADGRYGAALDSVFFTAGEAREALRDRLNIRIPVGSADTDLPVIAAAALIDSYLEHEDINNEAIEEKLRLIIESSVDKNGARPTADQVDLRVYECALILCVQAEQGGRHPELKERLYKNEDSFLCKFLEKHTDGIMSRFRKEIQVFSASVKLQSRTVGLILDKYTEQSKYSMPFLKKFFAESTPVLVTSIIMGILCIAAIVFYVVTYGNLMSYIATNSFVMVLVIILEAMFCVGLVGVSWLVYTAGENKEKRKK